MSPRLSSPFDLLLCRAGSEEDATAELLEYHGISAQRGGSGLLLLPPGKLPPEALVFERQRMPSARLIPMEERQSPSAEAVEAVWATWAQEAMPWGLHLIALDEEEGGLATRLQGVARELLRGGEKRHAGLGKWERKAEKLFVGNKGLVLQWLLGREGLWFSSAAPSALTSPVPGGRYRMRMDPDAPSRSYLKMEESLLRLGIEPQENETVIDLGAAPGGWTYAFAKRGCRVTAIDNGPLRLTAACVRRVEHLHLDGLSYQLPRHLPPVDWLVGDMLIPPGKAFGVLKYWVGGKHCRRLIFNIKLPQEQPMPALAPILDWLRPRGLSVRQLYHDRREVTVFGSISS